MTVPNREVKEQIARSIFKYAHPDIKWGHLDNSLYRKETKTLEDKCIDVAEAILNICYPCSDCRGNKQIEVYPKEFNLCPSCKGTGNLLDKDGNPVKMLAIVAENQELPKVPEVNALLGETSVYSYRKGYRQAQQDMIKAGWKKVYTDYENKS